MSLPFTSFPYSPRFTPLLRLLAVMVENPDPLTPTLAQHHHERTVSLDHTCSFLKA